MRAGALRVVAEVVAVAAACAWPAPAGATNVSVFGPNLRFGFPGEVHVTGTLGPNRIAIDYRPATGLFVVSDSSGVSTSSCEQLAPTRVRCLSAPRSLLTVATRGGSDQVRIGRGIQTGAEVNGGSGDDTILGGRMGDDLIGDRGDDLLRGKGGDDDLGALFDLGRDEFYGGGGNDDIDASEERSGRDRVIDCGAGRMDDAFVDAKRDPKPQGCEDVIDT
jgi:Ca2+-binding RTX toxin-like protein